MSKSLEDYVQAGLREAFRRGARYQQDLARQHLEETERLPIGPEGIDILLRDEQNDH